jgi:hypothetical protein
MDKNRKYHQLYRRIFRKIENYFEILYFSNLAEQQLYIISISFIVLNLDD